MQKVVGSNPIIRFRKAPLSRAVASVSNSGTVRASSVASAFAEAIGAAAEHGWNNVGRTKLRLAHGNLTLGGAVAGRT